MKKLSDYITTTMNACDCPAIPKNMILNVIQLVSTCMNVIARRYNAISI